MPSLLPSPRCALTAPFHPYRPSAAVAFKALAVKDLGGLFSVALSVGSRPPGVTWHLIRRSPDFPPSRCKCSGNSDCPAGSPADKIVPPGGMSMCFDLSRDIRFRFPGSSTTHTPHSATHPSIAPQSTPPVPAATPSPTTPQHVSTAVNQQHWAPPPPR